MNLLLERTFQNRGYEPDFFEHIQFTGHVLPSRIDELCRRLDTYRKEQKLLVILTDFDMDGIMCGTEAYAGFSELGFYTALWLPDVSVGYGFNSSTIDQIVAKYPNASGIFTGDVGISAFSGVQHAKELGLDIFVTDHHLPKASLPGADVLVDSYLCDSEDSFPEICGAYVLYQVLRRYAEYYMDQPGYYVQQIDRLRVFAGFGTLSDGMPLYHENRFLVRDAIAFCRFIWGEGDGRMLSYISGCDTYRSVFYGLYRLLQAFFELGKFQDVHGIDEMFVAYYVAPAFNSIKRMNGDIADAYDVFFMGETRSVEAIQSILDLTESRKEDTEREYQKLYDSAQPWAPYVYITEAVSGLRGLLAQKVLSDTGEPALVVGRSKDGGYSGSGRTPSWYPFLKYGLVPCAGWWAAGHNYAFGFGVDDEAAIDRLVQHLKDTIPKYKPSEDELRFVPDYDISTFGDGDSDIDSELFEDFLYELRGLRPFGPGFPEPKGQIRFSKQDVRAFRIIGSEHNHVKISLDKGLDILCFFQGDLLPQTSNHKVILEEAPDTYEVTGKLGFNRFRGVVSLQFIGSITNLSSNETEVDSPDLFGELLDQVMSARREVLLNAESETVDF